MQKPRNPSVSTAGLWTGIWTRDPDTNEGPADHSPATFVWKVIVAAGVIIIIIIIIFVAIIKSHMYRDGAVFLDNSISVKVTQNFFLLWKLTIHYLLHNNPSLDSVLSQLSLANIFISHVFCFHYNFILHTHVDFPSGLLPREFPIKIYVSGGPPPPPHFNRLITSRYKKQHNNIKVEVEAEIKTRSSSREILGRWAFCPATVSHGLTS
jgi:hypothetical protein